MTPIPRATWTAGLSPCGGLPPAWTSSGNLRPPLAPGLDLLIVHYTGATAKYVGQTAEKNLAQLRALYRGVFTGITVPEPKGDEYNYVIDPGGRIYEWAGLHRAAHCSGKNTTSIGVLFLLGVGEAPPLEMAAALLELRTMLVARGALTATHAVDQHGQHYPTDCPGVEVKKRWPMYDVPLPPAPPVTMEAPDMFWKVTDHPDYLGAAVVFAEVAPDVYVHIGPTDADRYATRAATTTDVWALSQPFYPGGWAALGPRFFPRA